MTTPFSTEGRQPETPRSRTLLSTIATRLAEGMITAGCVLGAVSPFILHRQRAAYLSSRPDERWSR